MVKTFIKTVLLITLYTVLILNLVKLMVWSEFRYHLMRYYPSDTFEIGWCNYDYYDFFVKKGPGVNYYSDVVHKESGTTFRIRQRGFGVSEEFVYEKNTKNLEDYVKGVLKDEQILTDVKTLVVRPDNPFSLNKNINYDFAEEETPVVLSVELKNNITDEQEIAQKTYELIDTLKRKNVDIYEADFSVVKDGTKYRFQLSQQQLSSLTKEEVASEIKK